MPAAHNRQSGFAVSLFFSAAAQHHPDLAQPALALLNDGRFTMR
jgi:hypothetical protein